MVNSSRRTATKALLSDKAINLNDRIKIVEKGNYAG